MDAHLVAAKYCAHALVFEVGYCQVGNQDGDAGDCQELQAVCEGFRVHLTPMVSKAIYLLYICISIQKCVTYLYLLLMQKIEMLQFQFVVSRQLIIKLSMFSLNEEISKFEKLALTLKDDTMAIDEKFLGGGIAMKDLIQQNSFIMSEMRKMKSVFLNYCKLNDKIYKKIIEHEMSALDHQQKLGSIIPTVDRKFEYFTIEVSKLKEITVKEVFKNRELIEQLIDDLKSKLQERVPEEGFDLRIKKLFEVYDQQNMSSSEGYITDQQGNLIAPSLSKKRKGGYSLEEIQYIAKLQAQSFSDTIYEHIEQNKSQIQETNRQIDKINPRIKKLEQSSEWLAADILETKGLIQQNRKIAHKRDEDILQELHEIINEEVWEKQFEEFNQKQLKPSMQRLRYQFAASLKLLRDDLHLIEPKLQKIHHTFHEHANRDAEIQKQVGQIRSMVGENQEKSNRIRKILEDRITQVNTFSKKIQPNIDKQLKSIESANRIGISQIKRSIANIVEQTKNQVTLQMQKKTGREIKQMKANIANLLAKEKQLRQKNNRVYEQLQHTKDVVAKKANHTDLLYNFDRKADRQDIQQLKQKLEQPFSPSFHDRTRKQNEQMQAVKGKKNRILSTGPQNSRRQYSKPTGNTARKSQSDENHNNSSKKYQSLEWEGFDFSQQLKTIQTVNPRYYKSMRPSTAINNNTNTLS